MSARAKHSRVRAGFSLIELMVALTVGGIVISAMYSMGASSARSFQVQQQIASMQSALRFAYTQLKRDITRAGLFGVPIVRPTDTDGACNPSLYPVGLPGGPGWYAAISSFRDEVAPNIVDPSGGLNPTSAGGVRGFSHDQVTLMGNYATGNEYKGITVVSPNQVSLPIQPDRATLALQIDFGWSAADGTATTIINAAELTRAFPVNGLIRLASPDGKQVHIATLTAAPTIGISQITFTFNPPNLNCTNLANGRIAPLQIIRYGAAMSAAGSIDTDRATGAPFAQLVRSTLAPGMTTVLQARPILDYLATFNLAFTATLPKPDRNSPDNYTIAQRVPALPDVNSNPERLRSVEVELGVRAPDVDRGMPWPCPAQACMALYPTTVAGSATARVRVLRSEVLLPNLAFEGR